MWIEKKLKAVSPRPLTSDGSIHGLIRVEDARGFYVKQRVFLQSDSQAYQLLEIKRFEGLNSFYVGPLPPEGKIGSRTDVSAFRVSENATIGAAEQDRPGIKGEEHARAIYVEEPVVARRVINVDETGSYYNTENPMPTRLVTVAPIPVQLNSSSPIPVQLNSATPIPVQIVQESTPPETPPTTISPSEYDEVRIERNFYGDPVTYNFYKSSILVGTIEVDYDAFSSSIKYKRTL